MVWSSSPLTDNKSIQDFQSGPSLTLAMDKHWLNTIHLYVHEKRQMDILFYIENIYARKYKVWYIMYTCIAIFKLLISINIKKMENVPISNYYTNQKWVVFGIIIACSTIGKKSQTSLSLDIYRYWMITLSEWPLSCLWLLVSQQGCVIMLTMGGQPVMVLSYSPWQIQHN